MKRYLAFILVLLASAFAASAQQVPTGYAPQTRIAGVYDAKNYNTWRSQIVFGNAATGSQSIQIGIPNAGPIPGLVTLTDGRTIPVFQNAIGSSIFPRLLVGIGANQETVTPTAVTNCPPAGPVNPVALCTITAVFANIHGAAEPIFSGSFGFDEAMIDAFNVGTTLGGGGEVVIDQFFRGTTATMTGSPAILPGVYVMDKRGTVPQYFALKPTTLTNIAAPAAPVPTTATTGGTIAAGTYRVAQTYVDSLGGETLISSDAGSTIVTSGATSTITTPAPVASTGAVGWRLYISAAGGAAGSEILYAPASAGCTVSTLSTTVSACAMGANAVTTALVTGTGVVPAVNTSHTALGFQPFYNLPTAAFQSVYGPFTTSGVITAAAAATNIAEVQLPAGYLNFLGKSFRVCGNVSVVALATAVPTLNVTLSNNFGVSPVTLITWTPAAPGATTVPENFCAVMTVAAVGASGTLEVHGYNVQAGVIQYDSTAAPSSAVNLTAQDTLAVSISSATANLTSATVRQLTIEPVTAN